MTDHLTENARLRAALLTCINMLDDLVAESGRGVEYGEEDAFRMGEWFEAHDLEIIATARATLATPAPDAVQEIVAEAVKAEREALQSMAKERAAALKDVCKGWNNDKGKASFTGGAIELVAFAAAIRARGEG